MKNNFEEYFTYQVNLKANEIPVLHVGQKSRTILYQFVTHVYDVTERRRKHQNVQ